MEAAPAWGGVPALEIDKCVADAEDVESEPVAAADRWAEEPVPPWREQVTVRGLVAALLIGFVYTVIILKLALTTGIIPTLNVSAALLAFLSLRGWTRALGRLRHRRPDMRRRLLHHGLRRCAPIPITSQSPISSFVSQAEPSTNNVLNSRVACVCT
jgi:hypothetical protein